MPLEVARCACHVRGIGEQQHTRNTDRAQHVNVSLYRFHRGAKTSRRHNLFFCWGNVFQLKAEYTAELVTRTLHYNAELRTYFFWRRIAKIEYGVNSHFL